VSFVIKNIENVEGEIIPKTDYKFVSIEADGYTHFYNEIFIGEISCYRIYNQDMNARLLFKDIYIKNNEIKKIRFLSERTDAGNLIFDYKELYDKWMNKDEYKLYQMNYIFHLYNEYKKNQTKD
jgi:hypothetical protein